MSIPDNTSPISNSSSLSNLASDSVVIISIPIAMKLTTSNYLAWQAQVLPIIHGYNLSKFIESPPPPSSMTSSTGQFQVNPDFLLWRRQDQLLLGWLRSSLSDSVQAQVVSSTTTLELWVTLQKQFASASSSRRLELRRQLQACQKNTSSCTEYLNNLRRIADELVFVGAPISDEELVMQAVQGLGTDYNPIAVAVNAAAHHNPFSFSDLHGLLVSHEALLKSQLPVSVPSAFYTNSDNTPIALYTNNSSKNSYRPRAPAPYFNNNSTPLLPNPISNPIRPPTRPNFANNNSSPLPPHSYGPRPSCQICFRPGHTGKLYYKRYNPDPEWQPNPRFQAYNAQIISHASMPPQSPVHRTSDTDTSSSWLLDSGANNHVTTDLNNLSSFFEYAGPDKLLTSNGKGLTITHIGSCMLTISDFSVKLTNVLYVPEFSTNLISISKLLLDNPSISINFCSSSCFLKDQLLQSPPLQIPNSNGLFLLHLKLSPQAFHGIRASPSIWHARFCHSSTAVTNELVNSFQLPCNKEKHVTCLDCVQAKCHRLPFYPSTSVSSFPLQLVHSDVWGPCSIVSHNEFKYYVTFIDDFSRFTWIFFLKHKSEVSQVFTTFKYQVENVLGTTIKILRTDGGTEYKPIATMFPQLIHQTSCPYTPQQNGTTERKHRHIIELALATMAHASIPQQY